MRGERSRSRSAPRISAGSGTSQGASLSCTSSWSPVPRLLLEIGCEELPAAACREAAAQMPALCEAHLGRGPAAVYVTPRRIAALVDDLPERTPDRWVQGPPERLREQAAAGFARRHGVAPDELEVRDGFLGVTVAGSALGDVLPARVDAVV